MWARTNEFVHATLGEDFASRSQARAWEREVVTAVEENGEIITMANWETISIGLRRRKEDQPHAQEGEVNWKTEKLEAEKEDNEDSSRPMLTMLNARYTYMARALQGLLLPASISRRFLPVPWREIFKKK